MPDLRRPSDHAPLTVSIAIEEEHIHMIKQTITKNSKEEKEFIKKLEEKISSTDTSNICQEHTEQKRSDPEWSGITLEWKGVNNKNREQPWPQLMHCASIFCRMCSCIFQED